MFVNGFICLWIVPSKHNARASACLVYTLELIKGTPRASYVAEFSNNLIKV